MTKYYVPILKWKQGERIALRELGNDIKEMIRPVLLVMKNTEADTFVVQVCKDWGINRDFYLDFHQDFSENPFDFMDSLLNEPESKKLFIIPVISQNTAQNNDYIQLIKDNAQFFNNGIALRIRSMDPKDVLNFYKQLTHVIDVYEGNVDIIVDLAEEIMPFPKDSIKLLASVVSNVFKEIQSLNFRNRILAGSSFPKNIDAKQNTIKEIERKEWILWKYVFNEFPDVIFGDYGVDDPHDPEYNHGITVIPTIRYTHEESWYIIRGTYNRQAPNDLSQFYGLAQKLIGLNVYCGKDFSWGDKKIFECANKLIRHGNLPTWVKIATNHHLTYVAKQVASFLAS